MLWLYGAAKRVKDSDHLKHASCARTESFSATWTPRRLKLAVLLVLVVSLGTLLWTVRPRKEPIYQGRTVQEWLADLEQHNSKAERATIAIKALGTNSIPILMKDLTARDSRLKIFTRKLIQTWFSPKASFVSADRLNQRALNGFLILGEQAAPATPVLIERLRDEKTDDSEMVTWALASIGETAAKPLLDAVKSENPTSRKRAMRCLGAFASWDKLGPLTSVSFQTVVSGLDDANPEVRLAALDSAREFTNEVRVLVPKLMLLMESKNLDIQRAATHALIKAGPPQEAIPLFTRVLNHPDVVVRYAATGALERLGSQAKQPLPAPSNATNELIIPRLLEQK